MKPALLTILVSIPLAAAAHAALFTLSPTADAFVTTGPSDDLAGNNYGTAGALGVAGSSSSKGVFESVMRFNTTGLISTLDTQFGTGQWVIESITLRLTSAAAGNPIFNAITSGSFSIQWMQNDTWSEGVGNPSSPGTEGITYTALQGLGSAGDSSLGTFSFDGTTGVATTWTLGTPTAFINDIKAGGNVGLRFSAADANVSYLFNSQNNGTAGNRPLLSISAIAIPEPGAALLLSAAGLLLMKRRHRHVPQG